jgi:hypothetical protein
LTVDFPLAGGLSRTGRVVGPDGQPFRGATVAGLAPTREEPTALDANDFTAHGLVAGEGRLVAAVHAGKKLAGTARLSDEDGTTSVRLAPWGSVSGRLTDAGGKPLAGANVWLGYPVRAAAVLQGHVTAGRPTTTDADGLFRLDVAFAGTEFFLTLGHKGKTLHTDQRVRGLTVAAGETKALGDIAVKAEEE